MLFTIGPIYKILQKESPKNTSPKASKHHSSLIAFTVGLKPTSPRSSPTEADSGRHFTERMPGPKTIVYFCFCNFASLNRFGWLVFVFIRNSSVKSYCLTFLNSNRKDQHFYSDIPLRELAALIRIVRRGLG